MDDATPGVVRISAPRRGNRMRSVSIDGVELRTTSSDALALAAVSEGDALSPAGLHRALDAVESQAAMNRALRLLGHRERSKAELASRLEQDGYPEQVIAPVLTRLIDYGYLDDHRFAEDYARSKSAAGWGRRRVSKGLAEKGVGIEVATDALDAHLPDSDELERACATILALDVSTPLGASRALRRLIGRGFDYDVARQAVERCRSAGGPHVDDL